MRLTEKCWRNLDPWECCGQDKYCQRGCHDEGGCTNGCKVPKMYCELADYEDAEEQGLLLRFRCKVGDKIYCPAKELNKVIDFTIINIDIYENEIFYVDDSSNMWEEKEFGTMVFLTPEEAESALAEKGAVNAKEE